MSNTSYQNKHFRSKWIIGLLLVAILIISGCSGVSSYKPRNYLVGTEGLVIEFQKQNKETVYELEEFGTLAFIKNKGAASITSVNPAVLNINYDEYRLTINPTSGNNRLITNLEGKNQYNPVGSEEPAEIYFKANLLTKLREGAKTKLVYNLCYPYKTEITTVTCIDTKLATRDQSAAACKSEPYSGSAGQGAPIVITKIEPEIQLQNNYVRPQFKIYISNLGRGYVTNAQSCESADITNGAMVGMVNVDAWISGVQLKCGSSNSQSNTGILKLIDTDSVIKCYLPEGSQGYSRDQKNYLTPLTVKATYTYINIEEKEIEIKRDDTIASSDRLENDYDNNIDQGNCNSYQVYSGGKCISKCEYCASNAGDSICNTNIPYGFTFKQNFGCNCDLAKCNELSPSGKCIKGYCPGNVYCCAGNTCAAWEVWDDINQNCVDKCTYCKGYPLDTKNCGFNTQNFTCRQLTSQDLDTKYKLSNDGITRYASGFCNENINNYCVNDVVVYTPTVTDPAPYAYITTLDSQENTDNSLCNYCAGNGECKFENNGIKAKITSEFTCSCIYNDKTLVETYNFVPDKNYCNNGLYCCNN